MPKQRDNTLKKAEQSHGIPSDRSELRRQFPALAAAADLGIDIHMLLDNLQLSVSERIRRHDIALNTMLALQKARKI